MPGAPVGFHRRTSRTNSTRDSPHVRLPGFHACRSLGDDAEDRHATTPDHGLGLRQQPHTPGDFTEKDASLRIREVKLIGDYAITYWVDSPVKTVMIADVRPADH
jgi:hypothetical protein